MERDGRSDRVKENCVETLGLLDTGAQRSVSSENLFDQIGVSLLNFPGKSKERSASGHSMAIIGQVEVTITSGKVSVKLKVLVISKQTTDCIMEIDYWKDLPVFEDIMHKLNQDLDLVYEMQVSA